MINEVNERRELMNWVFLAICILVALFLIKVMFCNEEEESYEYKKLF